MMKLMSRTAPGMRRRWKIRIRKTMTRKRVSAPTVTPYGMILRGC